VRALNRDLHLGVEIVGMPIVREADGLAMSSRNAYLTPDQRRQAIALWRGLQASRRAASDGVFAAGPLKEAVRAEVRGAGLQEEYIELVDASTLERLDGLSAGQGARMLVAGGGGSARLVESIRLGGRPPPAPTEEA